jgi:phosphatidylglycerophosphate synthase
MISVKDIYWYSPNLVDYTRYFLVLIGSLFAINGESYVVCFGVTWYHYAIFSFLMYLAWVMCEVNGRLARYYNQCSIFGIVIDYGNDTIFSAFIYMNLSRLYPYLIPLFLVHISMEIIGFGLVIGNTMTQQYWKKTTNTQLFEFFFKRYPILERITYNSYIASVILLYVYYFNPTLYIQIILTFLFIPTGLYFVLSFSILQESVLTWRERIQ